jgi:hypothetical protein
MNSKRLSLKIKATSLAVLLGLAFALMSGNTNAEPMAKPKALSAREEGEWVNAVKSHKTDDDGATVLEVLQFVQRLRPKEFKIGAIEVGYNGATGLPDVVGVDYWIGLKRLQDDAYVNLGFDVKKSKAGFDIKPFTWPLSLALQKGRDAFLAAVDEEYQGECIDPDTKKRSC